MEESRKHESISGNMLKVLLPLIVLLVVGINLVLFLIIRNNNKRTLNLAMSEIIENHATLFAKHVGVPHIAKYQRHCKFENAADPC